MVRSMRFIAIGFGLFALSLGLILVWFITGPIQHRPEAVAPPAQAPVHERPLAEQHLMEDAVRRPRAENTVPDN